MDTKEKSTDISVKSGSGCPMVDFVSIISGKWAIPILYRLIVTDDVIRFGALQRAIGSITQKELTKQLRSFEALGLVTRTVYPEMPPRVEYQITKLGKTLKPTLDSLARWMTEHKAELSGNEQRFTAVD
ncbi:putative HTH-type transcriptional regulator YybR [Vibrio aerogenes CECT 7868]|uniref:Putative HTH-type transcriptional regulator YybR n=1 Tax=Vibrio aerogenes CECT 7868 TaxID=1216006 RepID=A0A1M5ZSC5_9VIBR|nr:helix-turn-helix domain-containing protein [Vibrio aerogenes]SHI27111.1 putative HTH-type transcriptional regulator YybR [Vibrio aerogenes CECT 7868]